MPASAPPAPTSAQPALPAPPLPAVSRLLTLVLGSGLLVLGGTVALAVWGPHLGLPGARHDTLSWTLGSMLLGGLLLITLHSLMLRPLARWQRSEGRADATAAPDASRETAQILQSRAAAERLRTRQLLQLRALIDTLPQGAALSCDRRFEMANAAFCELVGWQRGELHGRSPFEVFSSANADDRLGAALRLALTEGRALRTPIVLERRDGTRVSLLLCCRLVDAGDATAGTLWTLQPLPVQATPQPAAEPSDAAATAPAASSDPLTGLLSAVAFELQLKHWLRSTVPAVDQPAALLCIDLDGFKSINDAAGRAAGDAVLRDAATVLQAHVRVGDAVARLDGDSYAVLLPACAAAEALQLAERLRSALSQLGVPHEGQHLGVGATVGVAEADPVPARRASAGAAAAWMARAHAAWYEAKYGGQGGVRLAAPAGATALVLPA